MNTTNLKVTIVSIDKGQYLTDTKVLNPLPTNAIIHKTLCGLGATYGEIHALRHSIIIEPNVPVIEGKVKDHNSKNPPDKHILGIHKGIYRDDIVDYLASDVTYKKLLTTPEGFISKVIPAMGDNYELFRKSYFLLLDECERNIQDVSYRSKINVPFDLFFDFENKALVSATTLPFSEPLFNEHGFTHYIVKPTYKYNQSISLTPTNNVLEAVKEYIADNYNEHYCFFLNSTDTILALMRGLGIEAQSKVFCAGDSVMKLKLKGIQQAHTTLDTTKLAKFNFFTSRFFSAVDIELPYKPDLIMITDLYFAEHSILDPETEVIQIVGRFRNGVNKITHITNTNPEMKHKSADECKTYLDGVQGVYKQLLSISEKLENEGGKDFIKAALTTIDLAKYFKNDGEYNWFMFDNYVQEEKVKGFYANIPNLQLGYSLVKDHFDISFQPKYYLLGDIDRLRRESPQSKRSFHIEIARQLEMLEPIKDGELQYFLGDRYKLKSDLAKLAPVIAEGHEVLKMEGLKKANYSIAKITVALKTAKDEKILTSEELTWRVWELIGSEGTPSEDEIKLALQKANLEFGLKVKVAAAHIKRYYIAERTTIAGTNTKGYKIKGYLH